jgi:F-type H+-transporting ATPase subunit delta
VISRDIARRYADALYDLAAEEERAEEVSGQLSTITEQLTAVQHARTFLIHPLISRARKMAFLDAAFPSIDATVRGLLGVVVRNSREDHLWLIAEELEAIRVARAGITRVIVNTAVPLDDAARERLTARLQEALGGPAELVERIDERLLGGARIEVAERVIDGTVSRRLERLAERLEG